MDRTEQESKEIMENVIRREKRKRPTINFGSVTQEFDALMYKASVSLIPEEYDLFLRHITEKLGD